MIGGFQDHGPKTLPHKSFSGGKAGLTTTDHHNIELLHRSLTPTSDSTYV